MAETKTVTPVRKRRQAQNQPTKFGQKERMLVFFGVSITVVLSAILGAKARGWKLPKPNFSSTVVLGSSAINKADPKAVLDEKTKNLQGNYGIYVIDIKSGKSYGVSQNKKFEGASLFKLPLIIAIYEEAEKGNINISDYRDYVESMIKHSDNQAFLTMINVIGYDRVNQVLNQIGMENTSYTESTTTPYDIGLLLDKLMKGHLVTESSKNEIIDFMKGADHGDWIVKGVPDNIQVAHKYGSENAVINDAGIVFAESPYIVVILSQNIDEGEAAIAIPEISKIIFDLQTKQN